MNLNNFPFYRLTPNPCDPESVTPTPNARMTANGTLVNTVPMGDRSVLETWRTATPVNAGPKQFGRVKVTKP